MTLPVYAQYVSIPDSNFRNFIRTQFPSAFNASGLMDTTNSSIISDTTMLCQNMHIYSVWGIQFFDSLKHFDCSYNHISSLPSLPKKLQYLACGNNLLSTLPLLPVALNYLDCQSNQITALPTLPPGLLSLNFNYNNVSSITVLPSTLTLFFCSTNPLHILPTLPSGLQYLDCTQTQISSLPTIPASLLSLYCCFNNIGSIPVLPNTLTTLNCMADALDTLPILPTDLKYFYCDYNHLTSLPILPTGLKEFRCIGNQIPFMPQLPAGLFVLECDENLITTLPSLPNTLERLSVAENAHLNCLPLLPNTLLSLYTSSTGIGCLPNLPPQLSVGILPVCGTASTCEPHPTASGKLYYDVNNNNIFDSSIDIAINSKVFINSVNSWTAITNQSGNYLMKLDSGVLNTIRPGSYFPYDSAINPASYNITPLSGGSQGDSFNFAIHLIPNIYDLQVNVINGHARSGQVQSVTAIVANNGTSNVSNVTLKVIKPSFCTSVTTNPTYSSISGDTLIWNSISLNIFKNQSFYIQWLVNSSISPGTNYVISGIVLPITGDTTPLNNVMIVHDSVRSSYDPNEKLVNIDALPVNKLNTDLAYTVYFQNTGNDTAFYVYIQDSLSNNLDLSTFQMLGASHTYQFDIRDHGLLEVIFPNIKLVDSSVSRTLSQGYFQYTAKPKKNLQVGTLINNRADIFFDKNAAILTNTVHTKIVDSLVTPTEVPKIGSGLQASIFPNPASKTLYIVLHEENAQLTLYNVQGAVLQQQKLGHNSVVNISKVPAGLLIGKIETAQGYTIFKVSKVE